MYTPAAPFPTRKIDRTISSETVAPMWRIKDLSRNCCLHDFCYSFVSLVAFITFFFNVKKLQITEKSVSFINEKETINIDRMERVNTF